MNDCYWGGDDNQYYYECDTGRVIGEVIRTGPLNGPREAFYFDAWSNPKLGRFIDNDRARKAVENARKKDVEVWERRRAAWNAPAPVEEEPVETPRKSWWKVWE